MNANAYWLGAAGAGRLAVVPRPRGADWLADDMASLRAAGIDTLVGLLTPLELAELDLEQEAALAEAAGLVFISFPIPDRGVPADTAAAHRLLAQLSEALASGKTVAVHCRLSVGRSSLIAAALLVRAGWPVERVWLHIAEARGLPVPDTDAQRQWVAVLAAMASES